MQIDNLTTGIAKRGHASQIAGDRHYLRFPAALLLTVALTGCGTVYDPKPWVPDAAASPIAYPSASDASTGLSALAAEYHDKAGESAREALALDIPLAGLAFAAPVNAAFHGAKDVTIGLGFGSTAFSLGRTYFNPHLKVSAYNDAGTALACASTVAYVASNLSATQTRWLPGGASYDALLADVTDANAALVDNAYPPKGAKLQDSQRQSLISASDAGKKLLGDLNSMELTISTAPQDLSDFANNIVDATSAKILSGSQDVDAVLKLVPKSDTTSAPPPPKPASQTKNVLAALGVKERTPPKTVGDLVTAIELRNVEGSAVVQAFNGKWGNLKTCVLAKTSG